MATDADGSPDGPPDSDPAAAADGAPTAGGPPRDAEDWTDEQWLAWLAEADEADPSPDAAPMARLQRSAGGRLIGNAMLGVAEALYGARRPEIVVEAEVPGDPHDDDLSVHLDPDDPERSTVVVRRRPGGRRRPDR